MASTKNVKSKTVIFKSEQHPTILTEELKKFYDQNKFFDTVFKVGKEGYIIEVHQIVLCALSGYFLEIFSESQTSFLNEKLVFNDIEFDTIKLIIDFMYTGTIELSVETIEDILRAASFLKVKPLIAGCCSFIQKRLKPNNCLRWFLLGYDLELPELKTIALECISNNYKKISESKLFLKLSENEFKELQSYEQHLEEEDVFMGMIAWLNFDNLNRKHLLLPLLTMVRFEKLTPKFILENRKKVCKTVESYEMICTWLQWHLLPETRSSEQLNQTLQPKNTIEDKTQTQKLVMLNTYDDYNALVSVITYNGDEWDCRSETYLSKVFGLSFMVLIDDKLVIAGGSETITGIEYINLKTEERNVIPLIQKDREIAYFGDANGILCVVWMESGGTESLETYDFLTNEWTFISNSLHYNAFSRSTIDNGIFYHISFDSGCLHSYNFDSMEWTSTAIAQDSLQCFSFVASGGFLYIMSGKKRGNSVKACKRYDLSNNSWSDIAPHPVGYQNLISMAFENKIITSNRAHIFEYDIDNNEWKQLSPVFTKYKRVGTFCFSKLTTNTE